MRGLRLERSFPVDDEQGLARAGSDEEDEETIWWLAVAGVSTVIRETLSIICLIFKQNILLWLIYIIRDNR